jgi:hypothetical protein
MNEIVAHSPVDLVAEFGSDSIWVSVPLRNMIFERNEHTNGLFVVGSEYLDSQKDNMFDTIARAHSVFSIRNVERRCGSSQPSRIVDLIEGVQIFNTVVLIPESSSIVEKCYFFTDAPHDPKTIVPYNNAPRVNVTVEAPRIAGAELDMVTDHIANKIIRALRSE